MSVSRAASKIVNAFRSRPPLRSGSLIVTVFGDTVAPRGGPVWVGSLIRVLEGFGINERLVRTSVYRLVEDGWLRSTTVGRRSYYDLTDYGRDELERASTRIYGEPRRGWGRRWQLVLLDGLSAAGRERARRELKALGFGSLTASVVLYPSADQAELDAALAQAGAADEAIVLDAATPGAGQDRRLADLARKSWDLDELESRYRRFLDDFRPALEATRNRGEADKDGAFRIRTLLVHEYRKIVLRDPLLPAELLPADWQGLAAYRLCRNLYRATRAAADDYAAECLETTEGPVPPPGPAYFQRFGGLT